MIDGEKINISHTMTQKSLPRIITKCWSGANIYTHARGFHLGRKITTWRARPIVQRAMGRLSLAPGSPSINFAAIEFGGENRGMYSRGRWLRKQEENFFRVRMGMRSFFTFILHCVCQCKHRTLPYNEMTTVNRAKPCSVRK
jgi:hypothetical protein